MASGEDAHELTGLLVLHELPMEPGRVLRPADEALVVHALVLQVLVHVSRMRCAPVSHGASVALVGLGSPGCLRVRGALGRLVMFGHDRSSHTRDRPTL